MKEDDSDANACCCSHGEQCVCFATKTPSDHIPVAKPKPRLATTQSEGVLTVFTNGHHKPVHRHNNAAHDANMPYRVHKPHPHAPYGIHATGRRSVDSLVSTDKVAKMPHGWLEQLSGDSEKAASISNGDLDSGLAGFPTTMAPINTNDQFTMSVEADNMSSAYPQSALSDGASTFNWDAVDWTALQTVNSNQPALTYASSGTISELGDHTPPDENVLGFNLLPSNPISSDSSRQTSVPTQSDRFTAPGNQADMINRWSMPASFWLNQSSGPLNNSNVSLGNDTKQDASGTPQDFGSAVPSNAQDAISGNLSMFAMPDFTTQDGTLSPWQEVDELLLQYSGQGPLPNGQPAMSNLGYTSESDVSEIMYTQGQPNNTFFDLDSGDSVEFGQSFVTPESTHEGWPN